MVVFRLRITIKLKCTRCPREKRHSLNREPKATRPKNRRNVSMIRMIFNALVPRYLCNCSMVIPLLLIVIHDNKRPTMTLKDFLTSKHSISRETTALDRPKVQWKDQIIHSPIEIIQYIVNTREIQYILSDLYFLFYSSYTL